MLHSILLKDQLGLVNLLNDELPYITSRAEAVVDLAFNVSIYTAVSSNIKGCN